MHFSEDEVNFPSSFFDCDMKGQKGLLQFKEGG